MEPSPPPAPARRVTSADVARRVGVARPTVSAVFGARSGTHVSPQLRQRILDTAHRMGYRTNTAARATRAGRFGAVGVLQAAEASRGAMHLTTLFALQTRAAERDMHLSMGIIPEARLTDPAGLPKVLREWCVDGLLISYTSAIPPLILDHIKRQGVPVVWMNVKLPHDCVHLDDHGAARGSTEILLELGHRRVTFVGEQPGGSLDQHYSVRDRYDGYAAALAAAGLPAAPQFLPPNRPQRSDNPSRAITSLADMLRGPDRPTAILTTHDATDVLFAAHLAGLVVPDDLSVVVLADEVRHALGVRPAQMRLHSYGLGFRAFEQLLVKIRRPHEPLTPVAVYSTFERGQTLAPPPGCG